MPLMLALIGIVLDVPKEIVIGLLAIFLLREEALEQGVGERELLEEARRVADRYTQHAQEKKRKHMPPLFWMGIGAAIVSIAWFLNAIL